MSFEDFKLPSSTSSWSSVKWSKVFVNVEQEKSIGGRVLDYWWSLAGKLICELKMSPEDHLKLFQIPDPRTRNWLLVESLIPVAVILAAYYTFVVLGYRWMRM